MAEVIVSSIDHLKQQIIAGKHTLIADEPREVIVQAFVDGAGLTPKGAQTYFYNCRRRAQKTA